jgi:phosphate transport system substrate-binding protein
MVMGGVVLVVNLKDMKSGDLKLTPEVLSDIFLGKITKWNDKAIAELNSGKKLPPTEITVVHRADGSGTTWIFTNYLDKVSKEWHEKVGTDKSVNWPVGVGGKGNEGVAGYVQKIKGAIGYVEYAYAVKNTLAYTQLKNQAGQFVSPTLDSFQAAAKNADWTNAPGFYMVLTDQPGETSWPISGATFILIHKNQKDIKLAKEMLKYFSWCFKYGTDMAKSLDYVPMPENVITMIENLWKTEVKGSEQIW